MKSKLQVYLRPIVMACYFIVLLVAVPLSIVYLVEKDSEAHVVAWFVAGIFVLATIPISLWDISLHLANYTQPDVQRYYVRIIWMVPIYSLDSWLALRFATEGDAGVFLNTARECYEAYVIYNFMMLLLTYLKKHAATDDSEMDEVWYGHLFPLKYWPFTIFFKPWLPGKQFIHRCTIGTLQYTLIRIVTTATGMVCFLAGYQGKYSQSVNGTNTSRIVIPNNKYYSEGEIAADNAYIYLAFINNVSQVWAMYCLVLFYYATKKQLQALKPFGKFMCVKLVVFASFWQSVVIAVIGAAGGIPNNVYWTNYTQETVKSSIQDFIVCIEMFFAAIAHHYTFSATPYIDYAAESPSCLDGIKSMWDVSDVKDDIVAKTRTVIPRRSDRAGDRGAHGGDESTGLLAAAAEQPRAANDHGSVQRDVHVRVTPTQAGRGAGPYV